MKTHWKKAFNPNYLGAWSFDPGQEIILTIAGTHTEKVKNTDGKEEECLVCSWAEGEKPMILNKTNCKAIAKAVGSPYMEDWTGKKVSIYISKVKAFGDMVEALRIREKAPQPKRKLSDTDFQRMLESIEAGKFSRESAKEKFDLSLEQLAFL